MYYYLIDTSLSGCAVLNASCIAAHLHCNCCEPFNQSDLNSYYEYYMEVDLLLVLYCSISLISSFIHILIHCERFANSVPIQHFLSQTIAKTKLIPMTLLEVEERVNSFKRLGEEICRNIPDVLLATMNLLYIQYNKTR